MAQELKLKIDNYEHIEINLQKKGAKLTSETFFVDTYFNQPKGRVYKIVEKNQGAFINVFQAVNGKFEVVTEAAIRNPEETKEELNSKYGIKRIIKGTRKFYSLKNLTIIFNLINNVGEFLIVVGEDPTKDFIEKELEIQNPEYITTSFDELPEQK